MKDNRFVFLDEKQLDTEISRPSLTYWQDAWRRLKKHKMAMVGVVIIIFVILFGVIGPYFTPYSYSDQSNEYRNLPPVMDLFHVDEGVNLYLSNDYNMFLVSDKGEMVQKLRAGKKDVINKIYEYELSDDSDEVVILDFSYNTLRDKQGYDYDYTIEYKGTVYQYSNESKLNRSFPFGTDELGRDILTRVMYGARISLIIAFVATLVNLFIGVIYGSISGFEGGRVDNIMMH
jgi:oligopeptide transport system permease protein